MKFLVLVVLIGITAAYGDGQVVNKDFLAGYNKFTSNIYTELGKSNSGNFVVSPLSVDIILALVEYGSKGKTSEQLIKGLNLPASKEKLREAIRALTPKLNVNGPYNLSSANKVYVKKGFKLKQDFKQFAVDVYNAEVENIDFKKKESATESMNKWVEDKTSHNIKNLIGQNDIDDYTCVILLNAMFFRGIWRTKFEKYHTKKGVFYLDNINKTEVDFMQVRGGFKYYEDQKLNAKIVELPYAGHDVSLIIVLPNNKDGIKVLENKINDVVETTRYKSQDVFVKLPKFKIESKIEFTPILKKLGIVDAFADAAYFPDISDEPLKISKVVQKALIEVDEEGTTASAATAVILPNIRSGHFMQEPKRFIADHSFIFILKLDTIVLFAGRYAGK